MGEFEREITLVPVFLPRPVTVQLYLLDLSLAPGAQEIARVHRGTWFVDYLAGGASKSLQIKGLKTGTAVITGRDGDGFTASVTVTVRYAWWQWLIIILLFGWIWY